MRLQIMDMYKEDLVLVDIPTKQPTNQPMVWGIELKEFVSKYPTPINQ